MAGVGEGERVLLNHREKKIDIGWGRREKVVFQLRREGERERERKREKVCGMYQKFCREVGDGIGLALIACLSAVLLSCMSAFNLFRLYGKNKERESSSW